MTNNQIPEKKEPDFQDLIPKENTDLAVKTRTNPLAIASLVLALLPVLLSCFLLRNLFLFGLINGICYIVAIILGTVAKKQIKVSNNEVRGKGMANWGIGISVLAIVLTIVLIVLAIAGAGALIQWILSMIG